MVASGMASLVQTVCSDQPGAKGLCVIIANTQGNRSDMPLLEGVESDRVNMERTFKTLKFAVLSLKNRGVYDMMTLFREVARYPDYPPSYRRIAIVFAGHGIEGELCAHDGTIPIKDIIDHFQPRNCHSSIRGISKLFFIDACRGEREMELVVTARGGTAVPSKVVPQCGNSLTAYSTMEGYKAHEIAGGVWMTELSVQLLQDKSILDIMTDINKVLLEKFQNPGMSRCVQQPILESTLTEHINLLKESRGTGMFMCMYVYVCVHVYVCVCICMYVCMCICVLFCKSLCTPLVSYCSITDSHMYTPTHNCMSLINQMCYTISHNKPLSD